MPLLSRFASEARTWQRRLFGAPVRSAETRTGATPLGLTDFDVRERMYDGTLYLPNSVGGKRMYVLNLLGKPCESKDEGKYPVPGYFNPAKQIADFYRYALAGTWGRDLKPVVLKDGAETDVKPAVADALGRVWSDSKLDTKRGRLTHLAANQGTVGIRIVFRPGPDPIVYFKFDHPRDIYDVEEDDRGNVREIELRYTLWFKSELGETETAVQVREIISRDRHSLELDGKQVLTAAERENPLGVCPYRLLRHNEPQEGTFFGRHAYHGSEQSIHSLNFALGNLDESVYAHVWPYLFASGAGDAPTKYQTGKYTLMYVKAAKDVPQATFDPMVPGLDFAGATAHLQEVAATLRESQPEMSLNALRLLANLSGEALQQALKPAEAACLRARGVYESELVAAFQIALSVRVFYGLSDIGTGTGTREAADRAFDRGQGDENFQFSERPALPLTPAGRMAEAMAKKAEIEAKASEQRQAVLDANPKLVTTMVKGQAESAGLAGEFSGGGKAA